MKKLVMGLLLVQSAGVKAANAPGAVANATQNASAKAGPGIKPNALPLATTKDIVQNASPKTGQVITAPIVQNAPPGVVPNVAQNITPVGTPVAAVAQNANTGSEKGKHFADIIEKNIFTVEDLRNNLEKHRNKGEDNSSLVKRLEEKKYFVEGGRLSYEAQGEKPIKLSSPIATAIASMSRIEEGKGSKALDDQKIAKLNLLLAHGFTVTAEDVSQAINILGSLKAMKGKSVADRQLLINSLIDRAPFATSDNLIMAVVKGMPLVIGRLIDKGAVVSLDILRVVINKDWDLIDYDLVGRLVDAGIIYSKGGTLPNGSLGNPKLINVLFSNNRKAIIDPNGLKEDNGHDILWHAIHNNVLWLVVYLVGATVPTTYAANAMPGLTAAVEKIKNIISQFKILQHDVDLGNKYAEDKNKNILMVSSDFSMNKPTTLSPTYKAWNPDSKRYGDVDTAVSQKIRRILVDTFIKKNISSLNDKDNDGNTALMWLAKAGPGNFITSESNTYNTDFWKSIDPKFMPNRGDYWVDLIDEGAEFPSEGWVSSQFPSESDRRKMQLNYARTKWQQAH